MITRINLRVIWFQSCVPAIDNTRIVTEPDRDFVKTAAGTGEQAGKRVAHRVRSYPPQTVSIAMFVQRAREVVAVAIGAVFHFRPEHERFTQSVAFQKRMKLSRQGDGTFFPVLKLHRGGLA